MALNNDSLNDPTAIGLVDVPQGEHTEGIRVTNLSFAYPENTPVLKEIGFEVLAGSRVLLAGATGSGKSTLLRCLKPELTPHGTLGGTSLVDGYATQELNPQLSAGRIGFVMQDAHQQIVMDTVKAELAFGLENLGTPPELIQRRVSEIANYFGINAWIDRLTSELSGGEKQIVNLAAIIAMQPRTLLLDEPTTGLDPIASRDFIELVKRVNDELGITIVMVEHHQEDLLSSMNQVLYLEEGHLVFDGKPREFASWLYENEHSSFGALPVATRLYFSQAFSTGARSEEAPLDVKEGRWWLWRNKDAVERDAIADSPEVNTQNPTNNTSFKNKTKDPTKKAVLEAKHVWFRYSKEGPYILKDLTLKVMPGSILGIVGANASGKSTLLSLLTGVTKPQHGKVMQAASLRIGMLPQNPTVLFMKDTVFEELMDYAEHFEYGDAEVQSMLKRTGLIDKSGRHALDLSGGEQQKLALAKLLLINPDILLLDEPTKGLDSLSLAALSTILTQEAAEGRTVVMVSHDLEFVAGTADECLMLFDGATLGRAPTEEFFAGNMFYTTALQRITQGILAGWPPVLPWPRTTSRKV